MNKNLGDVKISGIRKFYNEVKKVEGAISLTLGQPDFEAPLVVKKAMIEAIETNKTVYTENAGILELRTAICNYLLSKEINYNESDICITVGGSEGLFSIFTALINKGDRVLIPTPAYPAYENIVKILGGEVVNYYLQEDFTLDVKEICSLIEKHAIKYLVLSLPSNPTGAILSKSEYIELIELIKEKEIVIISDEIYEALCYDTYYSVCQCEEILEKVIFVGGFSKMFSMTGLRIGYFACKEKLMNEVMKVHQYNVSCAPSISQYGALQGLLNGLCQVDEMKKILNDRREYVVGRLVDMGLKVIEPRGAFYVFPKIDNINMTSEEFCIKLLHEHKVACVPGDSFGKGGEGYFRISYCYSKEELTEALNRIEGFIKSLTYM